MRVLIVLFISIVYGKECYWNNPRPYPYFGTKTPYDTVRGDLRDHPFPEGCEAISVWRLNRHGNRNPSAPIIATMKEIMGIQNEIIASYEAGTSQLCAQDIENLRVWTWKPTVDDTHSHVTKTGYEELYNIGKRFAQKYYRLLQGNEDQFYLRPTNEQRTIMSCAAFVHGITDQIPLNMTVENPWTKDDVIRPYETCERYRKEVKLGPTLIEEEDKYFESREYLAVQKSVQRRLGIPTLLTAENILGIYNLCRYLRPWTENLQSPWCAVFSNNDLVVMEYSDDVSHYFRKGYGSWINVHLGEAPLKDLYESFEAVVAGGGKKLVAYFSHDTMMEMTYSAMGLYLDGVPITGFTRDPNRRWRTSFFGAFSNNIMAVLNRCTSGAQYVHKVQFFINELVTRLCPAEGCSWEEFQDKFQTYTTSDLSFCHMNESESIYRKSKSRH